MEGDINFDSCKGPIWNSFRVRINNASRNPSYFKHISSNWNSTKHRNKFTIFQLRRNLFTNAPGTNGNNIINLKKCKFGKKLIIVFEDIICKISDIYTVNALNVSNYLVERLIIYKNIIFYLHNY